MRMLSAAMAPWWWSSTARRCGDRRVARNLWRRLVITGAAIIRLNDEGLRADVVPSFALEYTFR